MRTQSIPQELIEAGARGHLVVLVGEGASHEAGLPTWPELIQQLRKKAHLGASSVQLQELNESADWFSSEGELLAKASFLGEVMGRDWLIAGLSEYLRSPRRQPAPIHKALARLPDAIFLTTNHDALLEQALEEHLGRAPQVVFWNDLEALQGFGSGGQVLKLHGDLERPETLVLSAEDTVRLSHAAPQAWRKRLEALLQPPHQFLIVGSSYADVHFQESVNALRAAYSDRPPGPFWLAKQDARARTLVKAYALRPLWLEETSQSAAWLEQLAQEIEARRKSSPTLAKANVYAERLWERFRQEQERASTLFDQQRYEEARSVYQGIVNEATRLLEDVPDDERCRQAIASCLLNAACCLLNLQRMPEAREQMKAVAKHHLMNLPQKGRAVLAQGLAQAGELALAKEVLPDESEPSVLEARQLISIFEGRLPETGLSSPILRAHALALLEEKGDMQEVARRGLQLLESARGDAVLMVHALANLSKALRRSALEDETAVSLVPMRERATLVETLERGLTQLEESLSRLGDDTLRRALRLSCGQIRFDFYGLVRDERTEDVKGALEREWGPEALRSVEDTKADLEAQRLAVEGRLEEALKQLHPDKGSWRDALLRAQLARLAGNTARALEEALSLCQQWPGKAPIEHLTADLLFEASRPEEALTHAQAAFESLPGYGYRLLLGECLLACGRREEAARLIEPLLGPDTPMALRACAIAVEESDPGRGLRLWEQYLTMRPEDLSARLRVALLQHQLGRHEQAAEQGWQLFQGYREQLAARELYLCAQLVLAQGASAGLAREHVREIINALEERFPGNMEAEEYRMYLAAALGFPDEVKPFDLEKLAEAGVVRAVAPAEVQALLQAQHQSAEAVWKDYQQGRLPFEALCALTGTEAAYILTWPLDPERAGGLTLCPPVTLTEALPLPSLSGARILVGELELLLLQHLGLPGRIRKALGEDGRLLLFQDVWERMCAAATSLVMRAPHAELSRKQELIDILVHSSKVSIEKSTLDVTSDRAWAAAKGLSLIGEDETLDAVPWLSPVALARELGVRGLLERSRADKLAASLSRGAEPVAPLQSPPPERAAITQGPLLSFFEAGALEALLSLFAQGLAIGPETWRALSLRHAQLRGAVEAARLAAETQRVVGIGLEEGWIRTCPRPLPELPAPRKSEESGARAILVNALGFRQALVEQSDLWLLTADSFVTAPLGAQRDLLMRLAWPSGDAMERVASRMRGVARRALSLPALVRFLLGGEARGSLEKLAGLGFVTALEAEDLLRLARDYASLDTGVPKRLLDRLEWRVRGARHFESTMAGLRISRVYGQALWDAFVRSPLNPSQASMLATVLLSRAEEIDRHTHSRLLDGVLMFACLGSTQDLKASLVPGTEAWSLSLETRAGGFWSHLRAWAGPDGRRHAAYARALREVWLSVDEHAKTEEQWYVLSAALLLPARIGAVTLQSAELHPLAVLSANWERRLLSAVGGGPKAQSAEQSMQSLADSLTDDDSIIINEELIAPHRAANGSSEPAWGFPSEAVLLRASREGVRRWALELAVCQGPHDGRAYPLLMKLAQEPEHEATRRDYARLTVVAPWRLVREDPLVIRTWGRQQRPGPLAFPTSLEDLRSMLSEPPQALGSRSLFELLTERLNPGGAWAEREDQEALIRQACCVPGILSAFTARSKLEAEGPVFDREVAQAFERLRQPDAFPSALLAGDIYFLRVAANRSPYVELPGQTVDLREVIPALLLGVLKSALNTSPTADSLAATEPALLRLCADIVRELAGPQRLLMSEGAWLAFRLYQWLWEQLRVLSPDSRSAALRALAAATPPPESLPPEAPLFHPLRFGPGRLDYRLMTLLHAFSTMEDLLLGLPGEKGAASTPARSVTSTALEDLLADLAARPRAAEAHTLSPFEWYGPSSVPELALKALLSLNPEALLQLPEARRLRWIQELPPRPDSPGGLYWPLAARLMEVLSALAPQLSAPERVAFEERLRALDLDADPNAPLLRWLGLTGLHAAGHEALEPEVRASLSANLAHPQAPRLFTRYLLALASRAPERLETVAQQVLSEVESAGLDPVLFAGSVGVVAAVGQHPGLTLARNLLKKLAERPPYHGQERMRSLLGTLGML